MEKKTKIIIGLGAVGVLLVGLLIGSSHSSPAPSADPTQTAAPAPVATDDETYIGLVRSYGNSYIDNAEDYQLIKIAHDTCDVLDSGYTLDEVINYLAANGTSTDQEFYQAEGIIIGGAINVYCPVYLGYLP